MRQRLTAIFQQLGKTNQAYWRSVLDGALQPHLVGDPSGRGQWVEADDPVALVRSLIAARQEALRKGIDPDSITAHPPPVTVPAPAPKPPADEHGHLVLGIGPSHTEIIEDTDSGDAATQIGKHVIAIWKILRGLP